MIILSINHVLCRNLNVERVREEVEDEWKIDITKIYKVISFCFINLVDIIPPLVAIKPGVINLISKDVYDQIVWIKSWFSPGHIEVEFIKLIHKKCAMFLAFLCKSVVLHIVSIVKSNEVVVHDRFAPVLLAVDILHEFSNLWSFFDMLPSYLDGRLF